MVILAMCLGLTACDRIYGTEKGGIILPLADGSFGMTVMNTENDSPIKPNITKEQGDEIFNNINVFGNKLRLPLRVSDLPEGFSAVSTRSYLFFDNVPDEEASNEDTLGTDLYDIMEVTYKNGEHEYSFNVVVIDSKYLDGPIIVGLDASILDSTSTFDCGGICVGKSDDEFIKKYGEGYVGYRYGISRYASRVYYDGERCLSLTYSVDPGTDANLSERIANSNPMIMSVSCLDTYSAMSGR